MKRFWSYFFVSAFIIAVTFVLVSLVMASIHGVSMLAEWQSWFSVEATEEVAETTNAVVRLIA